MARILGQSMDLVIDGEVLGCAKNFVLNIQSQKVEVTYENSDKWADWEHVKNAWNVSATHLYTTSEENLQIIFSAMAEHRTIAVVMRRSDLEGYQYYGDAIVEQLSLNAGLNEPVGFNFLLMGKGELNAEEIIFVLGDENDDFLVDENGDFLLG